ncbi:helix-turn-helix transcriptional regulator [Arthrobacter sp. MI7-26]|uniref:helix-turn-helix transcriptional regulator n=1 Tax=Arthrobacter sp. MI7-26 TaxID=2993653 RepID=UPI002249808C|nr:helix-turn-helix transcriptional regulator [Arthrobacter sp. MI7-26]MCX2747699.1 helix-turn-helix transcriptional regulator [Arthrobacter sp. MI7-26]
MDNKMAVREFLASRRAKITPQMAGLTFIGGRRRVPGLRREEVAMLAGVSVDYYTKLERGNLAGTSESVLESIARALKLDDAERDHLYNLARAASISGQARRRPLQSGTVRPTLQFMLDSITTSPAFIGNGHMDIVAANQLGFALYSEMYRGPARPANHSRFIFLDPRARDFYPNWELAADTNVAILRTQTGRNPFDKRLADLVGELSMRSEEFRTRWAAHNVRRHYAGTKYFHHPVVGDLELAYESMDLAEDPGFKLTVYPAVPGSPSDERLRLLASWAATERIQDLAGTTQPLGVHQP